MEQNALGCSCWIEEMMVVGENRHEAWQMMYIYISVTKNTEGMNETSSILQTDLANSKNNTSQDLKHPLVLYYKLKDPIPRRDKV